MSVIAPFPPVWDRRPIATFDRRELNRILDLYGRMVAAGLWKDYSILFRPDAASFHAFRRAAERPGDRAGHRARVAADAVGAAPGGRERLAQAERGGGEQQHADAGQHDRQRLMRGSSPDRCPTPHVPHRFSGRRRRVLVDVKLS